MTAETKYKNLQKYLKRKSCIYTMCDEWLKKDGKHFIKWYDEHSKGLTTPKMCRMSKEFVYSPDNFIILDEAADEENICKAVTNPVAIAHDKHSNRWGYVNYKDEEFISYDTKEEAEMVRRKHALSKVAKRIEADPTFKDRLDLYKSMLGKHK